MTRILSLFPGEVYPPVTSQSFTLSAKTSRSGYGVIGRFYLKPVIQPDAVSYERFGLFVPLGNPPDWPPNTTGTFALSAKVNRVTNNLLGRHWPRPWVTIPKLVPWWNADGTGTCEFNAPASTSATFEVSGQGFCEFVTVQPEAWWIASGFGGCEWFAAAEEATGFAADGAGTCRFFATATPLQMDGAGGASFTAQTRAAATGFEADGFSTCRFISALGTDEACLTPPRFIAGGEGISNFVF